MKPLIFKLKSYALQVLRFVLIVQFILLPNAWTSDEQTAGVTHDEAYLGKLKEYFALLQALNNWTLQAKQELEGPSLSSPEKSLPWEHWNSVLELRRSFNQITTNLLNPFLESGESADNKERALTVFLRSYAVLVTLYRLFNADQGSLDAMNVEYPRVSSGQFTQIAGLSKPGESSLSQFQIRARGDGTYELRPHGNMEFFSEFLARQWLVGERPSDFNSGEFLKFMAIERLLTNLAAVELHRGERSFSALTGSTHLPEKWKSSAIRFVMVRLSEMRKETWAQEMALELSQKISKELSSLLISTPHLAESLQQIPVVWETTPIDIKREIIENKLTEAVSDVIRSQLIDPSQGNEELQALLAESRVQKAGALIQDQVTKILSGFEKSHPDLSVDFSKSTELLLEKQSEYAYDKAATARVLGSRKLLDKPANTIIPQAFVQSLVKREGSRKISTQVFEVFSFVASQTSDFMEFARFLEVLALKDKKGDLKSALIWAGLVKGQDYGATSVSAVINQNAQQIEYQKAYRTELFNELPELSIEVRVGNKTRPVTEWLAFVEEDLCVPFGLEGCSLKPQDLGLTRAGVEGLSDHEKDLVLEEARLFLLIQNKHANAQQQENTIFFDQSRLNTLKQSAEASHIRELTRKTRLRITHEILKRAYSGAQASLLSQIERISQMREPKDFLVLLHSPLVLYQIGIKGKMPPSVDQAIKSLKTHAEHESQWHKYWGRFDWTLGGLFLSEMVADLALPCLAKKYVWAEEAYLVLKPFYRSLWRKMVPYFVATSLWHGYELFWVKTQEVKNSRELFEASVFSEQTDSLGDFKTIRQVKDARNLGAVVFVAAQVFFNIPFLRSSLSDLRLAWSVRDEVPEAVAQIDQLALGNLGIEKAEAIGLRKIGSHASVDLEPSNLIRSLESGSFPEVQERYLRLVKNEVGPETLERASQVKGWRARAFKNSGVKYYYFEPPRDLRGLPPEEALKVCMVLGELANGKKIMLTSVEYLLNRLTHGVGPVTGQQWQQF